MTPSLARLFSLPRQFPLTGFGQSLRQIYPIQCLKFLPFQRRRFDWPNKHNPSRDSSIPYFVNHIPHRFLTAFWYRCSCVCLQWYSSSQIDDLDSENGGEELVADSPSCWYRRHFPFHHRACWFDTRHWSPTELLSHPNGLALCRRWTRDLLSWYCPSTGR